ncbi:MAG TPA: hypothetical protein VF368_01875 [Gemmatimonadaceae bacterium]
MNDVASEPAPETVRERGWWRVVVATLLFLLVPATPVIRVVLPIDQALVLLAPALAGCAVAGWWAGGRLSLALMWIALAAWVLVVFTRSGGSINYLACGWVVLLAATFASLVMLTRGAASRSFSSHAFAAIGLTFVIGAGVTLASTQGAATVGRMVSAEASKRGEQSLAEWRQTTGSKEWNDLFAGNPDAKTIATTMQSQLEAAPAAASTLFPSMLALESLVALAIAWAVYHRIGRGRLGPPLAALKDFRFSDQFVWGLVAGLALIVVPGFASMRAVGANLLVFFGALYALRGVGVGLWFLSPGPVMMALLILFGVVFPPVLGVVGVGLGVGDTWLNWRARAKPKT